MLSVIMLSVPMLSVVMLSVAMLSIVMLSVLPDLATSSKSGYFHAKFWQNISLTIFILITFQKMLLSSIFNWYTFKIDSVDFLWYTITFRNILWNVGS